MTYMLPDQSSAAVRGEAVAEFNINDTMVVILTEFGAQVWNRRYDGIPIPLHLLPEPVSSGYVLKDQMWDLMQTFGPHIHLGGEMPFLNAVMAHEKVSARAADALDSHSPAAQASATIQLLHNVCADVLLALRNCDRQPLADLLEAALRDLPASAPIQAAPTGMHAAADLIDAKAQKYLDENADTENDTGAVVFHYGEAGRDYHSTLVELAEELRLAATIQEPVMVAEPVGAFADVIAENERIARANMAKSAPAAPMVADPAGVALAKLTTAIWNLQEFYLHDAKALEAIAECRELVENYRSAATVKAVPSEALDTGPFTLEQRMPPKGEEVLIYFAGSNGKMECRIDEWDDLHEDPIGMGGPAICVGEGWVSYYEDNVTHWAPIPAVNFAAPLADKTGGGE